MKDIELPPLPERDTAKPAEEQGVFRKFDVRRTDGSSEPGGKHHGCEYFVIDVAHDPSARAALASYADAVEATHPVLAADMRSRYVLTSAAVEADRAQRVPDAAAERERILGMLTRHDWSPSNIFRYYYPSVTGDWVDLRELRTLLASTPAPAQQEPVYCTYPACQSTGKTCLGACAKHAAHHQEPPHQERKPMTDEIVRLAGVALNEMPHPVTNWQSAAKKVCEAVAAIKEQT